MIDADRSPVTVAQLVPGDVVHTGLDRACFVAQTRHPIWSHLRLVIWRMADGSWSHDALDSRQVVGGLDRPSHSTNQRRLRAALTNTGQPWTMVEPDVCAVDGCDRPAYAVSACRAHWDGAVQ